MVAQRRGWSQRRPDCVLLEKMFTVVDRINGARRARASAHFGLPFSLACAVLVASLVGTAVHAQQAGKYDADEDGLIDIDSLEKLNAVRYDLDGDGRADNGADNQNYARAFPNPQSTPHMGCPAGNCIGYELTADLDFAGSRWSKASSTEGWAPIGDTGNSLVIDRLFRTNFRGNGHTISNMYINRPTENVGLFAGIANDTRNGIVVEGVGLVNVDVMGSIRAGGIMSAFAQGASAGGSVSILSACYVTGSVRSQGGAGSSRGVGGLIGSVLSNVQAPLLIRNSYAIASVGVGGGNNNYHGGLVGSIFSYITISASYAAGPVGAGARRGGLVGTSGTGQNNSNRIISNSYWDREATGQSSGVGFGFLDVNGGVAQTGRQLRAPTTYTGIYSGWNLDLNGVAGGDYPWDFGDRTQYPVLRYGSSGVVVDTARQFAIQPRASSENRLASLTVTPGFLVPSFSAATTQYSVAVVDVDSVTVSAAAADGRYPPVIRSAAGDADGVRAGHQVSPLSPGASTQVTITVEAEDYTTREYVVTITRNVPLAAQLTGLGIAWDDGDVRVTESFDVAIGATEHAVTVPHRASVVTVETDLQQGNPPPEIMPRDAHPGTDGHQVELGENTETVVHIAAIGSDGSRLQYRLTITREAPSDVVQLSELRLSGAGLNQSLAVAVTRHAIRVPFTADVVTVVARTDADVYASLTITPDDENGGVAGHQVMLVPGVPRVIRITVTAEDRETLRTYSITATRDLSANANLRSLRVSAPGVGPLPLVRFTPENVRYDAYVSQDTTGVTVTAQTDYVSATRVISWNNDAGESGTGEARFGTGSLITNTVVVTAHNAQASKTYVVTVEKSASHLANLMIVDNLTPSRNIGFNFANAVTTYDLNFGEVVTHLRVTATALERNATITITDVPGTQGFISGGDVVATTVGLPDGFHRRSRDRLAGVRNAMDNVNSFFITVTASGGQSSDYTINAVRADPSNARFVYELTFSPGRLEPPFAADWYGSNRRYTVLLDRNIVQTVAAAESQRQGFMTITIDGDRSTAINAFHSRNVTLPMTGMTREVVVIKQARAYYVDVTRAPSNNANLSDLSISPGTLAQTFNLARTMYTATVDASVRSLTVSATAADSRATVDIQPGETVDLALGANVITATVTAQDGDTERAYVITVTRQASSDADLAELSVSSGVGVMQRFDLAATTKHSIVVPFTVGVVTVTAVARDDRAGLNVTSDAAVAAGDASGYRVNVPAGETITITVTVTAEDGTTRKRYEIKAMREAPSSDAKLRELRVFGNGVNRSFDVAGTTTRHTVSVPFAASVVTVTAVARRGGADVIITPADGDRDVPGHQVALGAGAETTINIRVTAEDGVTTQAYRITVDRPLSSNADLQSLRVSATEVGELSIGTFDADTLAYELFVEQLSVEQVTVFATTAGYAATLDYSWTDADGGSGVGTELTLLPVGATTLTITVTAQDGSEKEYTVAVSKSRGRLADLMVSEGTLNFRGTQAGYTVNVANIVTSLRVTATAVVGDTMIRITDPAGDGTITAGAEATTIIGLPGGLRPGSNRVEITATGSDGTNGTYTVDVVRAQAGRGRLADLSVQGYVLVPPFAGDRFGSREDPYTVRVPHRVTSVQFRITARPIPSSTLYDSVYFYDVTEGSPSLPFGSHFGGLFSSHDQTVDNLQVGTRNLRIDVSSGHRNPTDRRYFVDVIRAGSSDANLSALGISPGELVPAFSSATTAYTATADSSVSRLAVSATANDANATVRIEPGETVDLAPGANVITATVTAQDGVTEKAYVITVTRPVSSDADLAELGVSTDSGVMQRFDLAAATQHTVLVPFPVGIVTVTAVARDRRARLSVVAPADAAVDADGHRVNQQVNLRAGATTTITIRVTAEDGTTRKRYEIKAMREAASSDADLAELGVSSGVGVTRFDLAGDTTEHAISVPFAASVVTVTAVARHAGADVTITPDDADAGVPGHQVNLVAGVETAINIRVTAEDGMAMQAYRITVDRALSSNADLQSLRVSAAGVGELSIGTFDADTLAYELTVEQLSVDQVTVLATTAGFAATLDYSWADADGGAGVGTALSLLPVGATTLTITVTAQDGSEKEYTVAVSKSRGRLADLMVSAGTLNFRGTQAAYTVNVANIVTSLRVTATAVAGDTMIRITDPAGDGSTTASGVAATTVGLPDGLRLGANAVGIVATGSDGTQQAYTVNVTRGRASPSRYIATMRVSEGTLTPPFATDRHGAGNLYTVRVPHRVTSIRFMTVQDQRTARNYSQLYYYDVTGGGNALLGGHGTGSTREYNQDVTLRAGATRSLRIDNDVGGFQRNYYVDVIRAGSPAASLSALGVSPGELEPAFSSTTLVYRVNVTDTVASVVVTPMADDGDATVEIDGVAVARGAGRSISIGRGLSVTVAIEVTASDGVTTNGYTVVVTRDDLTVGLESLSVTPGTLVPEFDGQTLGYTVEVPYEVTQVTVSGAPRGRAEVTVSDVERTYDNESFADGTQNLTPGETTRTTITVTRDVGETEYSRTYTVEITRVAPSSDANLSALALSGGVVLEPAFSSAVTAYSANVVEEVSSLMIAATASHAGASVEIEPGETVELSVGENVVTATVTAQDGVTSKAYVVTVTRLASSDANLSALALSDGAVLDPAFSSATLAYSANTTDTVASVVVTPMANAGDATVEIDGMAVARGAGRSISIGRGLSVTVAIVVTAPDGVTTKGYTVVITRDDLTVGLESLSVTPGTLVPEFDGQTLGYTVEVPYEVARVTVNGTPRDRAEVTVSDVERTYDNESFADETQNLTPGETTRTTITVTRTVGGTEYSRTYTVEITRVVASSDANLSALALSGGVVLDPTFSSAVTAYSANVGAEVRSLMIAATASHAGAQVEIEPGETVELGVGAHVVTATVTAQDGMTSKAYVVTVTRAASSDAELSELGISSEVGVVRLFDLAGGMTTRHTVVVPFAAAVVTVTAVVRDGSADVAITPTDADRDLAGHQVNLTAGVETEVNIMVTAEDGVTRKAYQITVERLRSSNADLRSLRVSSVEEGEYDIGEFDADRLSYGTLVGLPSVERVTVSATAAGVGATLDFSWVDTNGVMGSGTEISLPRVGATTLTITVTAMDGTDKAYTVTMSKRRDYLAGLMVSAGVLNFDPVQANYTLNVVETVTSLRVTATAVAADTLIRITDPVGDGSITASGGAATIIGLPGGLRHGSNRVEIALTGSDGTRNTYVVNVVRAAVGFGFLGRLSTLDVSQGHLVPPFASGRLGSENRYVVRVPNQVTSVRVTMGLNPDTEGGVAYDGIRFYQGDTLLLSRPRSFAPGSNRVTQDVGDLPVGTTSVRIAVGNTNHDVDRSTIGSYYVDIIRAEPSSDADLSALGISPGSLSESFYSTRTSYTATVGVSVFRIAVVATARDVNATVRIEPSEMVELAPGANVITATVTAQNGVTSKAYVITVTRSVSSDAELSELGISSGDGVVRLFELAGGVTRHTITAAPAAAVVTVTAVARHGGADVTITPDDADGAVPGHQVSLTAGEETEVNIAVTAEDGATRRAYRITLDRPLPSNADLRSLRVSATEVGEFAIGEFDADTLSYRLIVEPLSVDEVTVFAAPADSAATLDYSWVNVRNAAGSGAEISLLPVGVTTLTVTVTAQDGTMKAYTVAVSKSRARLSGLRVSVGLLRFRATRADYTLNVAETVASVRVGATAIARDTTIRIIDPVGDGSTTATAEATTIVGLPDGLAHGSNRVEVVVTGSDGTSNTYVVNIIRAVSSNANLSALALSGGVVLDPAFSSAVTAYSANVGEEVSSVMVAATASHASARVEIEPGELVELSVGENAVTATVTAQDGTTRQAYVITVTRAASSEAGLSELGVSGVGVSRMFDLAGGVTEHAIRVQPAVGVVTVTAVSIDARATVAITPADADDDVPGHQVSLVEGGVTTIGVTVTAEDETTQAYRIVVDRSAVLSSDATLSALALSGGGVLDPAFSSATFVYSASVTDTVASVEVTPMANDGDATVEIDGVAVAGGAGRSISIGRGLSATVAIVVTAPDGVTTNGYTVVVTRDDLTVGLESLSVTPGTLVPEFDGQTLGYTVEVPYEVTRVTVSGTPRGRAEVTASSVKRTYDNESFADETQNLTPGETTRTTITVTRTVGETEYSRTYTVEITRDAASSDANLSALALSGGVVLEPAFSSVTTTYSASVGAEVSSLMVAATASHAGASVEIEPGELVELEVGANAVTATVTAQDGTTRKAYVITVTRAASSDANLSDLALSDGIVLDPAFSSAVTAYSASVGAEVSSLMVAATASHAGASVEIEPGELVELSVGENAVTATVTAEDGTTRKAYVITVTRAASSDANLSALALSGGVVLDPAFSSAVTAYSASVGAEVSSLMVAATASHAGAQVEIEPGELVELSVGANAVTATVTAQDGTTRKAYVITVTRAASSDANLSDLALSGGIVLDPTFSSAVTAYSANVGAEVSSVMVAATASHAGAQVEIEPGETVELEVGANAVTATVTAEDGMTRKAYVITVTRAASSDANLSALALSDGIVLDPTFSSAVTAYSANVGAEVSSVMVAATASHAGAQVEIEPGELVELSVGANAVTATVTAQDGTTRKAYVITVTRAASSDANLSALALSDGVVLDPTFSSAVTAYSASVGAEVSSVMVAATASHAGAQVEIEPGETVELEVGANAVTATVTAQDGTTRKAYVITVTRAGSSDATLSSLALSGGVVLEPAFNSATFAYRASVTDTVARVEVTPVANDGNATITVDDATLGRGASHSLTLVRGAVTSVTFVVTAQDGVTTRGYTVGVARDDLTVGLESLSLSAGTLTPAFDGLTLDYTVEVSPDVARVTVSGTPRGSAEVTVSDVTRTHGARFDRETQDLTPGETTRATITVTRTVRGTEYFRTYTVEIMRASQYTVQVGVFLQGAYDGGRMSTDLIRRLPASQPYGAAPWNAPSVTAPGLSAGDFGLAAVTDTVVDWVLVELRKTARGARAASATVSQARAAALLLSDGTVAGVDGDRLRTEGVDFTLDIDDASEDLWVLVHHRNHLSVMATATSTGCAGADYCFDFRSRQSHPSRQAVLAGGRYAMFAGDVDRDNDIDADDEAVIRTRNLAIIGAGGYGMNADLDFDGEVLSADRYYIILNTNGSAAPACAICAVRQP